MTRSMTVGYALAVSLMLASLSAAAEPAPTPNTPGPAPSATNKTRGAPTKSTLQRASDDVLRQLRPSGLKRHAQGFGALAKRGYDDVVSKVSGKPAQR
jgi:hypothetical protein